MARILVVDDEEPIRALLTRLFSVNGHEVDAAADGVEAVDLVQKKAYDLMLIDWNMPRMSGADAVAVLRSNDRFKKMKILMVAKTSLTKDVEQAFSAGVDGYVIKPFDMDRLLAKVEETLARR